MKKKIILKVQVILLALFIQGCWAEEMESSARQDTKPAKSYNGPSYQNEINVVFKSGEKIKFPGDCGAFQGIIEDCQRLVYQYLGDPWGMDIHEISVSARESDSYLENFLIHGPSRSVAGDSDRHLFLKTKKVLN